VDKNRWSPTASGHTPLSLGIWGQGNLPFISIYFWNYLFTSLLK
jgi:hypothetical protein